MSPRVIRLPNASCSSLHCCAGARVWLRAGAGALNSRRLPAATRCTGRSIRSSTSTSATGCVYYRALQSSRGALDRYVASLNVSTATYDALVARGEDGVLGERLQRLRAPDRRQPLSDSRDEQRLSGLEHPPDSRRVRSDEAPGGRPERDARRDREDHPRGVQRAAAVARARPRRRRQRPSAQRGLHGGAAARAARVDSGGVRHQAAPAQGRSRRRGWCRRRRS